MRGVASFSHVVDSSFLLLLLYQLVVRVYIIIRQCLTIALDLFMAIYLADNSIYMKDILQHIFLWYFPAQYRKRYHKGKIDTC
jgi:hypothetical protein